MKYLMMIKSSETYRSQPIPQGLLEAMGELVSRNLANGILKDTAGLKPTTDGFRVRSSGGTLTMTDGPFAETKEVVGGYAIIEATSDAHAREIAREFMEVHRIHWPEFDGTCEARPVEEM
jgi:hypothetical protein